MILEVHPKEFLLSLSTGDYHKVLEVDEHYGWFTTENLFTGKKRSFTMNVTGNSSFTKLTREEVADFYLQIANAERNKG